MQVQLVTFKTAQLLKEKGFATSDDFHKNPAYFIGYDINGHCICNYPASAWDNTCPELVYGKAYLSLDFKDEDIVNHDSEAICIAYPQAWIHSWIRNEHKIHVSPCWQEGHWEYMIWNIGEKRQNKSNILFDNIKRFDSYEQALEAGILFVLSNMI